MEKKDIITFFDKCAPWWDADMIRNEDLITMILDNGGIREGIHVLDVACGTGVLFPDYLARNVGTLTAVDISSQMVKIAREKFPQEHVRVLCGDVELMEFDRKFDHVMVYNAFPHFPEPERLIRALLKHLAPGGTLTIAHGMSRAQIDDHHRGSASRVSCGLMHEDALAAMLRKYVQLEVKISDERMYQLTGRKL